MDLKDFKLDLLGVFTKKLLVDKFSRPIKATKVIKHSKFIVLFFIGHENIPEIYKDLPARVQMVNQKALELNYRMEIIFVSTDHTKENFDIELKRHSNWYMVPYEEEHFRRELVEMYQIELNPTIVVVKNNGEIITKDGAFELAENGTNALITWT